MAKIKDKEQIRLVKSLLLAGYELKDGVILATEKTRRDEELERQLGILKVELRTIKELPSYHTKKYKDYKTRLGGMSITANEDRLFDTIKEAVFNDTYLPQGYRKQARRPKLSLGTKHLSDYVISEATRSFYEDGNF